MKMTTLALILATALPQSAYAAEFLISETESVIIVEYNGEPEGKAADVKATQIAVDNVAKSTEAKPVQVTPVPAQVALTAPVTSSTDDEEKPSERSTKRAEASAARAKARSAKMARTNKSQSDTSSFGDNQYLQPVYSQAEE